MNISRAVVMFELAIENGDSKLMCNLGLMRRDGEGMTVSFSRAV